MILLPHLEEPIADIYPASRPMRGWMEQINATVNLNDSASRFFIFVGSRSDLPKAVGGIITLLDNYTYYFTAVVDLEGDRIQVGANSVILGASSENCRIKSTGLTAGTALISGVYTIVIRHITLESATIFDLDASATPGQAIDWVGVNLISSQIGTIKSYSNFVASALAFLGGSGLIFDGTFDTIAIIQTLFSGNNPGTIITLPATLTITRRFRLNYCSFVVPGAGVGIDVSTSASIPIEGYILDTVNFGGAGTYTQGVTYSDNKARWSENRGILNSSAVAGYYMQSNATASTILATSTPVKVAGTTTGVGITQRFTLSDNRATFTGAIDRNFKAVALLTLTSGNNQQVGIYFAKNGTVLPESRNTITTNTAGRAEAGGVQVISAMTSGDYLEVFVENNTAVADITVVDMNATFESLV